MSLPSGPPGRCGTCALRRIARAECAFTSLTEHRETVAAIVAEAVSPRLSISVEAPALLDEPPALCRGDGAPVFCEHASGRYTSQAVLDAERRLLGAARTITAAGPAGPAVGASLDGYEARTGHRLDPGQRHLLTAFTASGTLLAAGLRLGDAAALDFYLARGRVRSGSRGAMTEAAYAGWRTDMLAGKTTLMTAAS